MIFKKRKEERRKREHEKLRDAYPLNGHCPVIERTGDGHSVGRCEHALRGTFCPRHGNLEGLLKPIEGGRRWDRIEESEIPLPDQRDRAPEEVFQSTV